MDTKPVIFWSFGRESCKLGFLSLTMMLPPFSGHIPVTRVVSGRLMVLRSLLSETLSTDRTSKLGMDNWSSLSR